MHLYKLKAKSSSLMLAIYCWYAFYRGSNLVCFLTSCPAGADFKFAVEFWSNFSCSHLVVTQQSLQTKYFEHFRSFYSELLHQGLSSFYGLVVELSQNFLAYSQVVDISVYIINQTQTKELQKKQLFTRLLFEELKRRQWSRFSCHCCTPRKHSICFKWALKLKLIQCQLAPLCIGLHPKVNNEIGKINCCLMQKSSMPLFLSQHWSKCQPKKT